LIKAFAKQNNLGRTFVAPIDVFFDDYNFVQPDICFVSKERDFIVDNKNGIFGAPDLIVEVISPGSVRRDRVTKKELYLHFGVKEFWLVDPANRTIEIYVLRNDAYAEHQFLEEEGNVNSTILAGFELDLAALFA
jgi:Uma2 family endonuclease